MSLKPSIRVINGIRYVEPYWAIHSTATVAQLEKKFNIKLDGYPLKEIFASKNIIRRHNYPKVFIKMGRMLVNREIVTDPDYRLHRNDRIWYLAHIHEPPVLDLPIEIIYSNQNLLVINKPPSIPVHQNRFYKYNTLNNMMKEQYGFHDVEPIHRLDRTVSGLLIYGRNATTSKKFGRLMMQKHLWSKEYVCKVEGVFPDHQITCEAPIGPLNSQSALQCVREDGKSAKSTLKRLWTDGENSVVSVKIETGRTHQIRVHLQYLGYPILNDRLYNNHTWGPSKGKDGNYDLSIDEMHRNFATHYRDVSWYGEASQEYFERMEKLEIEDFEPDLSKDRGDMVNKNEPKVDPICLQCHSKHRIPADDFFTMFLHCRSYENDQFYFEAPLPEWAIEKKDDRGRIPKIISMK